MLVKRHKLIILIVFICIDYSWCKVFMLDHLNDVKGNNVIKEIRVMYTEDEMPPINITRGMPLFAEIDFVPRFFPTNICAIIVSVLIPETIRRTPLGGPWVIGWNQEYFQPPNCPLCTNQDQSYTIPVTLFLPDDGWCAVGPVPTGWKIEAVLRENMPQFSNSDRTIAMVIDEQAQLRITNRRESEICHGTHEMIDYEPPSDEEGTTTANPDSSASNRFQYNTKFGRFAGFLSVNTTNSL